MQTLIEKNIHGNARIVSKDIGGDDTDHSYW